MSKRVVTIGGGKGQSALLRALREYDDLHLSAIVSTFDNGGSTGVLRKERGIIAVGDVRRCFAALVGAELEELWNARDEHGHAHGNLVLADAIDQHGTLLAALDAMRELHNPAGRVIPVSEDPAELVADLHDLTLVGEESIDDGEEQVGARITGLRLEPADVSLSPAAEEAIEQADCIILTMGDLFTSLLPNLLVPTIGDRIRDHNGPVVLVCNRSTKPGETDGYGVSHFVDALSRYGGVRPTDVIIDDGSTPMPDGFEAVGDDSSEVAGVLVHRYPLADEALPHLIGAQQAADAIHRLCSSL